MTKEKFNLFIYGSLRDPHIFNSVCGLSFTYDAVNSDLYDSNQLFAEPAFLPRHRRVSPDNVYFYAVPDKSAKIEGYVIYNVPATAMAEIDRYEGKFYERETVQVNTARGPVQAQAYLAGQRDAYCCRREKYFKSPSLCWRHYDQEESNNSYRSLGKKQGICGYDVDGVYWDYTSITSY